MNIFSKLLRICNAFPKRFRSTISIIFLSKNFFRTNPTSVGSPKYNKFRTVQTHDCSPNFVYYLFLEWVKNTCPYERTMN